MSVFRSAVTFQNPCQRRQTGMATVSGVYGAPLADSGIHCLLRLDRRCRAAKQARFTPGSHAPAGQPQFAVIVNDKTIFVLSFTAPDFGR